MMSNADLTHPSVFKIEKDIRRVFIASLVFNNTTSIPLVIVIAIVSCQIVFHE